MGTPHFAEGKRVQSRKRGNVVGHWLANLDLHEMLSCSPGDPAGQSFEVRVEIGVSFRHVGG
jgi:hypothetical protein